MAFYDAEGDGCSWDCEPEILKNEFRQLAHEAIALFDQERGSLSPNPQAFEDANLSLVA